MFANVVAESSFFPSNSNANIVGGTPVTANDSALFSSFAIPNFDSLFCGATLIWEDVLLSAAHCEGVYNETRQSVTIGGTTLNGTGALDKNVPVRKAILHPDFLVESVNNFFENDIMLIFLQRPANAVIPLATFNRDPTSPPDDALVTVIGHGYDNVTTEQLTFQLNSLNMTIVNFLKCDSAYDILNEDVHVCATGSPTAIAPCNGDSGGPLFYFDAATNETNIVGLVSFGICRYRADFPSTVFTRVSTYQNWILTTICSNSLHPPTLDMCDGIVPLARIPKPPSSPVLPPSAPVSSPFPPTTTTTVAPTDETCPRSATLDQCCYLFIFRNRGTYVHRSILGVCRQKCALFPGLFRRAGWDCGPC